MVAIVSGGPDFSCAAHAAEMERIRRHLWTAEQRARSRPLRGLDPLRRRVRSLLLDELARYRRRGRYPRNHDLHEQAPFFIDRSGTRCAVAHLLELGGEGALVRQVAAAKNNGLVRELARDSRLVAWLEAAGLTLEEASEIQPSYCSLRPWDCVCYPPYPPYGERPDTVYEGFATANSENNTTPVRVEVVHGDPDGVSVGDVLDVSGDAATGDPMVVIRLQAADGGVVLHGIRFTGAFSCGGDAPQDLSQSQYVGAITAPDCHAYLTMLDPDWGKNPCSDEGGCGCAVPGGGETDPTSFGILVALMAAAAARRRRRAG